MRWALATLALCVVLVGCAEEPQSRFPAQAGPAADGWDDQLRGRAQPQNESQRIYH